MTQLVIIIVYLATMLGIGVYSRRKSGSTDNYFVAGRNGTVLLITGSLVATAIGSSATLGMAGLGFSYGLPAAWWLLVGTIGLAILGLFLAGKVRQFSVYTLPEIIARQYDRRMATASSVLIVISWVGIVAAQIVAAGKIMSILGIGDSATWMVIFSAVFIAYTLLGGQYSVIRTDLFQSIIIFGGIAAALAVVLSSTGGLIGLKTSLPADMFAFPVNASFSLPDLISMLLVVGLTYVVGPDMYSRILCARDDRVARKASLWSAVLLIPFAFMITVIGMGAAAIFPHISPEQALPSVIIELFSPWASGIVLAALLCTVMSSADTTLLSAGTILSVDIIGQIRPSDEQTAVIKRSRWLITGLGVISLLVALSLQNIINSLLFAYTIYTCGITLPVIAGFFKDKLKITVNGALAALVGGGTLGLISKLVSIKYLDLFALALCMILLFSVSFFERRFCKKTF